jgi:hypothetical protein
LLSEARGERADCRLEHVSAPIAEWPIEQHWTQPIRQALRLSELIASKIPDLTQNSLIACNYEAKGHKKGDRTQKRTQRNAKKKRKKETQKRNAKKNKKGTRRTGHCLFALLAGLVGGTVGVWFYTRKEGLEVFQPAQ